MGFHNLLISGCDVNREDNSKCGFSGYMLENKKKSWSNRSNADGSFNHNLWIFFMKSEMTKQRLG